VNPALAAAAGQAAAARLMTDTGRLLRRDYDHPTGVDPTTGRDTYADTTLYQGLCRIKPYTGTREAAAGDSPLVTIGYLVSVPLSVVDVRANDLFEVLTSTDGRLTAGGLLLKVKSVVAGSQVTARRLDCTEASP
jgi:hypothetical protein